MYQNPEHHPTQKISKFPPCPPPLPLLKQNATYSRPLHYPFGPTLRPFSFHLVLHNLHASRHATSPQRQHLPGRPHRRLLLREVSILSTEPTCSSACLPKTCAIWSLGLPLSLSAGGEGIPPLTFLSRLPLRRPIWQERMRGGGGMHPGGEARKRQNNLLTTSTPLVNTPPTVDTGYWTLNTTNQIDYHKKRSRDGGHEDAPASKHSKLWRNLTI